MANKYMKGYSTSLVIREMQIKTTMRFHFIPPRRTKTTKMTMTNAGKGCGKIGTLIHAGENVNGAATLENSLAVPQKVKYRDII